jgi:hypothetical protein
MAGLSKTGYRDVQRTDQCYGDHSSMEVQFMTYRQADNGSANTGNPASGSSLFGQTSATHETEPAEPAWLEFVAFSDQLDPFRDDWPYW